MGRIQPISLCKPCVMSVRDPNNVGRPVQTDPTLLRYASAITKQKKCWELLAEKFDRFQTLRNNTQQHPTTCNRVCKRTQHITSNNVGICWPKILHPFARGLTNNVIIIIPLFTLGSVYSTYAIGAEQMAETNHSNIIKHNRVKNPNWPEANQLAIYKPGQELFWTRDYCEQINPAAGQVGTWTCKSSTLTTWPHCLLNWG